MPNTTTTHAITYTNIMLSLKEFIIFESLSIQ